METKTIKKSVTKEIICSPDQKQVFETKVTFEGYEDRKTATFITTHPSDSSTLFDKTMSHIIDQLDNLDIGTIRIVNLFSKISSRLSMRNIAVDEVNLKYIGELLPTLDPDKDIVIMAFGATLQTSYAANETKRRLYELFQSYPAVYSLKADIDCKNQIALHPLFLGIRASGRVWSLSPFDFKKAIKLLPEKKQPAAKPKRKVRTATAKEE